MFVFIQNFVSTIVFRVKLCSIYCYLHEQEIGVPQDSILYHNVTLYIFKINIIADYITSSFKEGLFLFVDACHNISVVPRVLY